LIDWMRERMLTEGKIAPHDLKLLEVVDDPHEVVVRIFAGAELQGFPCGNGAGG
jgi:hypothetical protein